MEDVRLAWVGALDETHAARFRSSASAALDRALAAGVPLVLELAEAGPVDRSGYALLAGLGRAAEALDVPVRLDQPPVALRRDMPAGVAALFVWPRTSE